ncbi:hypothetical protein E3N88_38003 [Mikania micrantha]|uniref:non-specific serine/threonine protein kinase n=1 Tax=Mikania micrantha TaxID=192012 RepID=A0A5N6LSR6_9ASTR|nr:hypothetical protein E3N88_38003 [Mikania micrantha]
MFFTTTLILLLTVLDILVYYLQKLHEEGNGERKNSSLSSSLDKRSVHEEDHGDRKDSSLSSSSLLHNGCRSGSTTNVYTGQIISTFGYMDAEYFTTHRLTRKSDVYAFGVVLLEVLCGRAALDFTLDEQQHSLAGWAKHCIKGGNLSGIIDPCLRGQVSSKCLKKYGQIAYECLRTCSKDRPTMTMVLARLELVLTWTMRRGVISDRKKDGCESSGVTAASQLVVPPTGDAATLILKEFTYSELRTATRNFRLDGVIGEGSFGKVFIGWLDRETYTPQKAGDGFPVAIKKLNPESMQGFKEWQAEVNFLGKFSHPNIVKLLGYCQSNDKLLLVYEYMQKGSLWKLIRELGEALALPWYTRIKIAIGAAQGLAFLHTTENNVICRDVKSSNILLDEARMQLYFIHDFNAKLSDFGIARLGPVNGESHVTTCVVGTQGYAAPEYISTGQLYVRSDVYSFGVVMLEIITGLRAFDTKRHGAKRNLVDWAMPFLSDRKRVRRVMDPRLKQNYPLKAAQKAAKLILTCLTQLPEERPSMEEVLSGLQEINAIEMKPRKSKTNTIKDYP